jgi:hypothetical protein
MNGIHIFYEDIEEIKVDKNRNLIITFKKTENTKKIKNHLLKQFPGDHLDK